MKKVLLSLIACISILAAWADGPFRNHRYDSFKVMSPPEGSILFIGNSITDMHCWPEIFTKEDGTYLPIVNRGNSGTYSTEQSDNLESYLKNQPKKVFMMIGTNDLATSGGLAFSPEQLLAYVKSIVARIELRCPETKIYLYSILKNNTSNRVEATWLEANSQIKAFAETDTRVTYIDIYDKLANVASGGVWSYDNLHLTAASYKLWADELCPYLEEGETYKVKVAYPAENCDTKQQNGGLGGVHGMRATYMSLLPISSDDILVFGDEMVKNGEWQELLGSTRVKNRGTGWGYGGDIATTSKMVEATYSAVEGVTKDNAKAIFVYTGTGDANGNTDIETIKTNYKALVDKIREKSPSSKLYLMSLCPTDNASKATRITSLNEYMQTLAGADESVKYVDIYTALASGTSTNSNFFYPSNYLGGKGYVKVAQKMKEALDADFADNGTTVISDDEAEKRHTQAGLRNALSQTIANGQMVTIGTEVGEYDAEKMNAYDAKVAEAVTLLANDEITQEQVTQMISALNNALLSAMIMPEGVNLLLTTNANKLENKSGWVRGLVGTSNNIWSLPLASAIAGNLGAANVPETGFYWGMGNGGGVCAQTDVNGLSATGFNLVGRQAYTGSWAAQIYMLDKNVKDVGVQFSASGTLTNTSFSIWTIKGTSATCVAQSQASALPSGVQNYIASDVNLPAGERLVFIWNANNAGQTLNITDFGASYTNIDELPEEVTEKTYTINKQTAKTYRDGTTESTGYSKLLKTTEEPTVTLATDKNNMMWEGDNLSLYPGSSGCTYTLSAPAGYVIDSYSFTAQNVAGNDADNMTLTFGTKVYNTKTPQNISFTRVNQQSVQFSQAGANKGVELIDFIVKIKVDKVEKPVISTDEETVWYYITSASTKDYCANKVIYSDPTSDKMMFGNRQFNANYIWSFWEKDGKLAIRNYAGKYFGTAGSGTGGSTQFNAQETENYIYSINEAYDYFTIKDNAVELHAQQSGSVIVRWPAEAGGASLWKFEEVDVTDSQAALGSTTVQQGRVNTGIGNKNVPIIRSIIGVNGLEGTINLGGVTGTVKGTGTASIEKVKVYLAANGRELVTEEKATTWRDANATLLGEATVATDGTYTCTLTEPCPLSIGQNYLWIAYDISDDAQEGSTVDATITSYTIDGVSVSESNGDPEAEATIFLSEGTVLMPRDRAVNQEKGSMRFRIPAITSVIKDGKIRLVTLTDDRLDHGVDLPSHCYIVAQYSDDLGKTWSAPKVVAGTAETGGDYGHGDASIVTNRKTGELVGIMTCSTNGTGFWASTAERPQTWKTIKSSDFGETWTTPHDHTKTLYGKNSPNPHWQAGFSGSGAALQLRDGTLVSSFVNRQIDGQNAQGQNITSQNFYFFMSEDGGDTWHVQGTSGTTSADEPKTLERNNGDLAISVRASGYNFHNVTSDRGATWKYAPQTRFTSGISGNACDGEYMVWCAATEGNQVAEGVHDIAFITCPNNGSRRNVSIALSTDEGETFETPKTICPTGSGYSAATVLPDGTLGVYFEENSVPFTDGASSEYTLRFVRFSLDWASGGKYKFTDEHPYRPIPHEYAEEEDTSISDITSAPSMTSVEAPIFNLQGIRVAETKQPGIYLQNGQKKYVR